MTATTQNKRRSLKKVLVLLAVVALIFSVGSIVAVKSLYDGYFSRFDRPEFSGYLTYGDVASRYDRAVVAFESGQNTLAGYIYGQEHDKGLVVIVHGRAAGAEDYLAETLYFVDQGWRVFAYDGTGSYESEGQSTRGLPQAALDLEAALAYIEQDDALGGLPVMLYGHSWGGFAVTAVLNHSDVASAVASVSGFNSSDELLFEQMHRMMGPLVYLEYPFAWAYQTTLFGAAARLSAVDGINCSDAQVMIIHGQEDESISYKGASIMAHRTEITNPHVVYRTADAKGRSGHDNLYRSEAAVAYIAEKNREFQALSDSYDGQIPRDALVRYYEGVDKRQTSELDAELFAAIDALFAESLAREP